MVSIRNEEMNGARLIGHNQALNSYWKIPDKLKEKGISVIIPTVSGLLLGEIFTSNFHKCEIRTFISKQQF